MKRQKQNVLRARSAVLLALLLMLISQPATAQFHSVITGMDTIGGSGCGTGHAFSNLVTDTAGGVHVTHLSPFAPSLPGGPLPPFPTGAIVYCAGGKVALYYEDLALGLGAGFDDPSTGATRQATFCAVIDYIAGQFDFGNIDVSQPLRILVKQSFDPIHNPAPTVPLTTFYAQAWQFYDSTTSDGIVNGWMCDYLTRPSWHLHDSLGGVNYHAALQLNFDATYTDILGTITRWGISWHNDVSPLTRYTCSDLDLYSVLLHEMGHNMGWFSLVWFRDDIAHTWEGLAPHPVVSTTGRSIFSGLDWSMTVGSNQYPLLTTGGGLTKLITGTTAHPTLNSTNPALFNNNNYWLNNNEAPDNLPVYSGGYPEGGIHSYLSHLDDQQLAYTTRHRVSPGDQQDYVMGPFSSGGVMCRTYTKGEIQSFANILGYTYIGGDPFVMGNHIPFDRKMSSYPITSANYGYFTETVPADFTIPNTGATSQDIDITTDLPLLADGDDPLASISADPNSLVGFRGCAIGGNNHNALTWVIPYKKIRYTPPPDFYGRAQFGFNFTDGHEKGGFEVITIDVTRAGGVTLVPGNNMVCNPDFEAGSETRKMLPGIADEMIPNSIFTRAGSHESKWQGIRFSDAHPYSFAANINGSSILAAIYGLGITSGTVMQWSSGCGNYVDNNGAWGNGYLDCPTSSTGPAWETPYPLSGGGTNERYQNFAGAGASYYNLKGDAQHCHRYTLEFDIFMPFYSTLSSFPIKIGFADHTVDISTTDPVPTLNYSFDYNYTPTSLSSWQPVVIPFSYCGALPSNILLLENATGKIFHLDNLSLKEDLSPPPPLVVNITSVSIDPCLRRLTANVTNAQCAVTYLWSGPGIPVGTSTASVDVSPLVTSTYNVTVDDGCRTQFASITIHVDPIAAIAGPGHVCAGSNITLTDATPDGFWSSSDITKATINATSGVVTGVAAGALTITYANCLGYVTMPLIIDPASGLFTITGGGTMCAGTPGISIGLTGSTAGCSYQLYLGGAPVGAALPGTGAALDFGPQVTAGVYTVTANPGGACQLAMSGTATITVLASSTLYNVIGGGTYCVGGVGVHVKLSGSDPGISYQLYVDGIPTGAALTGTGGILDFGLQLTVGTYTVIATNPATGCALAMTGFVTVSIPIISAQVDQTSPMMLAGQTTYTYCNSGPGFMFHVTTLPAVVVGGAYTWVDGGTTSGPFMTPDYAPPFPPGGSAPVIHHLTVTVAAGGCVANAAVDVVVPPAGPLCSPCDYFNVNAYRAADPAVPAVVPGCSSCNDLQQFRTITATALTPAVIPDGYNYYIVNNCTLAPGAYSNDNFFVSGGVSIDLGTNAAVITACHFSASPNCMWKGINVDVTSGAAGSLTMHSSLMENAGAGNTAAINISAAGASSFYTGGSVLAVDGSVFNSNYDGILVKAYQPGTAPLAGATLPITVDNCVFTHRDFANTILVLPGTALANYPFAWPSAANLKIWTWNTTDPLYNLNNYSARPFGTGIAEGHVGISLVDAACHHLTAPLTGVSPATYDYNYIQIGNATPDIDRVHTNVFDNMFFGVQAQDANVKFNNNEFRHVNQGIAMYNQANDVKILGTPSSWTDHTNNRFYLNYQLAVHAEANPPAALYTPNDFTCVYGEFRSPNTYSTFGTNHAINLDLWDPAYHNDYIIRNNYIYNYGAGIEIVYSGSVASVGSYNGDTYIQNNQVLGKSAPGSFEEVMHGIRFSDSRSYGSSIGSGNVRITNNGMHGVQNGLDFASSSQNGFIQMDTVNLADYASSVHWAPTGNVWGIYVNMAPFAQKVDDNIVGAWGYNCGTLSYQTIGMWGATVSGPSLPPTEMECNSVHDVEIGFLFTAASNITWKYNQMMRNDYGFYLGAGGKIGTQGSPCHPSDNHWDNGACSFCAAIGPCADPWPGWGDPHVFQTYVYAGASALNSKLYYRTTPPYDITNNGHAPSAFAYAAPATLIDASVGCTSGMDPTPTCAQFAGFKPDPGPGGVDIVQDYNLYPNPSDGYMQITQAVPVTTPVNMTVYNALGQKVYGSPLLFADGKASVNLGNVASGMYLVVISDDKDGVWNKKVVIIKNE